MTHTPAGDGLRRITRATLALIAALGAACAHAAAAIAIPPDEDARAQLHPTLAYDGRNTTLLVWQQGRSYYEQQQGDILAVRVDANGTVRDTRPIVVSGGARSEERPQVAFGDGMFLVVWQDFRSGSHWDVYATRITADGRVLDRDGIPVAVGSQNAALPQVAPADGGFLVVWQALDGRHYRLHAALVSADGQVAARALSHGGKTLEGGSPSIARMRGGWLLGWNDEEAWVVGTGMNTRRAAWLREANRTPVVGTVGVVPAFARNYSDARVFAADGAAMFTGWGSDGRGERVAAAAIYRAANATPIANPNDDHRPGSGVDVSRMIRGFPGPELVDGPIAGDFGCGRYVLVTRALPQRAGGPYHLLAMRVSSDGRRIDPAPTTIVEAMTAVADPALAFVGSTALLVYEQETDTGRKVLRGLLLKDVCAPPS